MKSVRMLVQQRLLQSSLFPKPVTVIPGLISLRVNGQIIRVTLHQIFLYALLFKAEIENELNGTPLSYLNQIAQRAYGKENYYPSTLTKEEINEAIFNERLKEFAAEGKSWWDYIRMGYVFTKIPSLLGRQNETNILLWPISSDCFENNPNIRQTIGYN